MFKFYLKQSNCEIIFYDTESHISFSLGVALVKKYINRRETPVYQIIFPRELAFKNLVHPELGAADRHTREYLGGGIMMAPKIDANYNAEKLFGYDEIKIFRDGAYHQINLTDGIWTLNDTIDGMTLGNIYDNFDLIKRVVMSKGNICLCFNSTAANTASKSLRVLAGGDIIPGSVIYVLNQYTNTAQNPKFTINSIDIPIYYFTTQITTTNLDIAGTAGEVYAYYYYEEVISSETGETASMFLFLGKTDINDYVKKSGDTMTGSLFVDAENSNNNIGINIGTDNNEIAGKASLAIGGYDYSGEEWNSPVMVLGDNGFAQGKAVFAIGASSHAEGEGTWDYDGDHPILLSGSADTTTYTGNKWYYSLEANSWIYCPQTKKCAKILYAEQTSQDVYTYTMSTTLNPDGAFSNVSTYQIGGGIAAATGSHTEGYRCNVEEYGSYGHAEGYLTTVFDESGHSEGESTKAGYYSHAEGYETIAVNRSHAEGVQTSALGSNSHAEGYGSNYSAYSDEKGIGFITIVDANTNTYKISYSDDPNLEIGNCIRNISDLNDFSIGNNPSLVVSITASSSRETTFTTNNSLSAGPARIYQDGALGDYSHTEGKGTIALGSAQHVEGKYNIGNNTSLHIVGNGTSGSARSNAHTLASDGTAWFANDVYVKSTSGTNKDSGSKKLATEDYVRNLLQQFATLNGLNMPS